MTRAPPVTEIMGQPHLWGEFLVLMLSFFLEWYSHSRNLCLSCMGALPKSRGSRRCRRPSHPPSSHSFSSRPFHFSHIPHTPTSPTSFTLSSSLFLHSLSSLCRAFRVCRPVVPAGDRTSGSVPEHAWRRLDPRTALPSHRTEERIRVHRVGPWVDRIPPPCRKT